MNTFDLVISAMAGANTGAAVFLYMSLLQGRNKQISPRHAFWTMILILAFALPVGIAATIAATSFEETMNDLTIGIIPFWILCLCFGEIIAQYQKYGRVRFEYRISGNKK